MMRNILYIHGMGSSAASSTIRKLKAQFPGAVYAFDIPVRPMEAMKSIDDFVKENDIGIVIGTSLGGFYAKTVKGTKRIIINPAFFPDKEIPTLLKLGEEQTFMNPRTDGVKTYVMTEDDMKSFKEIKECFEESLDNEDISLTFGVFGTEDDTVQDMDVFDSIYTSKRRITYPFGHRINDDMFTDVLVPEIKKLI